MRREGNRLTARKVKTLKKRGRYCDGHGLELQVSQWGTKAWVLRYQVDGRTRYLGLGPAHTVKLVDARERARKARLLILDGKDPIDDKHEKRKAERLAKAKRMTFRQCADAYLQEHGATWRSDRHREQWAASLKRVNDAFGDLSVGDIDVGILTKFLEPVWRATPETGSRIRGRIERVLDWATARGFREGENPARWRGHFEHLLRAKPKAAHLSAMPYAELPTFMQELRDCSGPIARALELTILTAARTGEVLLAEWSEIDFANKLWALPASRMKSGRDHLVPLSDRALKVLEDLPRTSAYIFPGISGRKPLRHFALLEQLQKLRPNGLTVHGFRSTFSDWARDHTNYSRDVVEAALAHIIKDKSEAAYRRGDALDKRRRLMGEWARYCASPATATSGKVVSFGDAG